VWCGVVWCGVVWCGVACGVECWGCTNPLYLGTMKELRSGEKTQFCVVYHLEVRKGKTNKIRYIFAFFIILKDR
jgi:hypothetical protein